MNKKQISIELTNIIGRIVSPKKLTDEMCANYLYHKQQAEDYFMNDPELSQNAKRDSVHDCLVEFTENHIYPLMNMKPKRGSVYSDVSGNMVLDVGKMFNDNSKPLVLTPNKSNCKHRYVKYEFGSYTGHQRCTYCDTIK